ncbi:hypothetical protein ACJMK2_010761 [Sinanodonta woodiana]|uniref:Homeobox domain-containing protein n=1 Tax=Sinanodonta woodiana TaxID=1069815 RepID=A0ABD3VGJ0_SINWO
MSFAKQFSFKGPGIDLHSPQHHYSSQAAIIGQQVYRSVRSPRSCEHGELLVASHASGRTVCTCQMKQSVQTYVQRASILPETFLNEAARHLQATSGSLGEESSAFCPSITTLPIDSLSMASAGASFGYDNLLFAHPYGSFYPGLDLNNAARRKNATRTTTSALKAWLYEHRKNPYPTKGEKIMLAIVTRMTLTQVSTWFANARRRLKKEKRMGWSLKDDEDDSDCDLTPEESDNQGDNQDDNQGDNQDKDAKENLFYECSTSDENYSLNISDISDPEDQSDSEKKPTIKEHFLGLPLCANGHEINVKQNGSKYVSGQTVQKCDSTAFKTTSHLDRITRDYALIQADTVNITRQPSENGANKTKIWSISDIIGSGHNLNSESKNQGTC